MITRSTKGNPSFGGVDPEMVGRYLEDLQYFADTYDDPGDFNTCVLGYAKGIAMNSSYYQAERGRRIAAFFKALDIFQTGGI